MVSVFTQSDVKTREVGRALDNDTLIVFSQPPNQPPNLLRVYIRVCKHGNHFTFLHRYITLLVTGVKSYRYTIPTGRNYAVSKSVTGVKSYINTYNRPQEITPLVTSVKSYIYTSLTGKNHTVSYQPKILHIYITDYQKLRR